MAIITCLFIIRWNIQSSANCLRQAFHPCSQWVVIEDFRQADYCRAFCWCVSRNFNRLGVTCNDSRAARLSSACEAALTCGD